MITTTTGLWFLVVLYGNFSIIPTTTGTISNMQSSRIGPMGQDECVKAAHTMMQASLNIQASCNNGNAWVAVSPRS